MINEILPDLAEVFDMYVVSMLSGLILTSSDNDSNASHEV